MRLIQIAFGRYYVVLILLISIATLVAAGWFWSPVWSGHALPLLSVTPPKAAEPVEQKASDEDSNVVLFSKESWQAVDLKMEPVRKARFEKSVDLTGKIALNEDRIAHIFPLVDGRVDEVKIQLGDKVKKDQLLVVVQSTEVGRLMLQLYKDRLNHQFASTKDRWTQAVTDNTLAMIKLMRSGAAIEEIEQQLTDRPMGEYRDRLLSAYIANYKARKNLDRLTPLSAGGTITGKQLLDAESEMNASRATLQSLLEQFQQETQQASAMSSQSVKELETRVAVDETNLMILGFDRDSLKSIDPVKQGETVSHYPIMSPFDGTIISKDVVLLERVGPESQILSIADLSTVWVTADIFEGHLAMVAQAQDRVIQVRSPAWPDKKFEAKIFYTGDLVQEATRTVAMRAVADNKDGLLKPGMFVNIEFPSVSCENVTQVPLTAVLEHEGKPFVFVHLGEDRFERRDVVLGMSNSSVTEITSGVEPNDVVVIRGGFALKSQMLAELLAE